MLKTANSKFTYDKHKLVHFRPGVPFDRMVLLLNSFVDLLSWTALMKTSCFTAFIPWCHVTRCWKLSMIESVIFLIISYTKAISTSAWESICFGGWNGICFNKEVSFPSGKRHASWKISSTFKNNHPIILSSSILRKKLSKILKRRATLTEPGRVVW